MQREQIKELAVANGFKLKAQPDGDKDLNPHVYEFANALAAKAVMDFAATPVGAYEAGFVDTPHCTIGELYQAARHHVRDNYGIEINSLAEEMGEDFALECTGGAHDAEVIELLAGELAIIARSDSNRLEYQSGYLAAVNDCFVKARQLRQQAKEVQS